MRLSPGYCPKYFAPHRLYRDRNLASGLSLAPNDGLRHHSEVNVPDLPASIPHRAASRVRSIPGYFAPRGFRGLAGRYQHPESVSRSAFQRRCDCLRPPLPFRSCNLPDQSVQPFMSPRTRRREPFPIRFDNRSVNPGTESMMRRISRMVKSDCCGFHKIVNPSESCIVERSKVNIL